MPILLVIPHLGCNLFCYYCYEKRYRQKHETKMSYNLEVILKRMESLKSSYPDMCLHGGEPLMMPKQDVRTILLKMKELTGKSSIQTNGVLIDDDFIDIFKECSTSVGLSCDGPGELSEYRFYRLKKDPEIDKKIKKMIEQGINLSMIMVVTKANAGTDKRLKKLKDYLLELGKMRISGRINPCGGARECELDEKRIKQVYLELADFCLHHNLKWSPFNDIINGLQGKPRVCSFTGCDPFCTSSAAEMLEDGSLTNCMRTNQEYILLRHPIKHDTRDEILPQTPQEFGGCQGCQYWSACHGGCSTMTINDDWRNKTYLCSLWYSLFQFYEKVLAHCNIPLGICRTEKKPEGSSIEQKLNQQHIDSGHGDQIEHQDQDSGHGDRIEHQDSDHGDRIEHQDSGYGDQTEHQDHLDCSHNDALPEPPLPQTREEMKETKPDEQHAGSGHGDWPDHGDSG